MSSKLGGAGLDPICSNLWKFDFRLQSSSKAGARWLKLSNSGRPICGSSGFGLQNPEGSDVGCQQEVRQEARKDLGVFFLGGGYI